MFNRTVDVSPPDVTITVDGNAIEARDGDTVAAAMLTAGIQQFRRRRSPVRRGDPSA